MSSPSVVNSLQSQSSHSQAYKSAAYNHQQLHQPNGYEFFNNGPNSQYASNPGFQTGYANGSNGSGGSGSNNNSNNFWWSKFQQQQNTHTPNAGYSSVNYSTPISGYSASNGFDGLQQYNNLIRNLHSNQAAKTTNNSSSSTSSSPNSSSSSTTTTTSTSSACLSNSLTSQLNSLVEQSNNISYHNQQLHHGNHLYGNSGHNLPITPDESNTDISSNSSSILNHSSQRNNSRL